MFCDFHKNCFIDQTNAKSVDFVIEVVVLRYLLQDVVQAE